MNMHTREEKMAAFGRYLDVLDALRNLCPWDRKQTNKSIQEKRKWKPLAGYWM